HEGWDLTPCSAARGDHQPENDREAESDLRDGDAPERSRERERYQPEACESLLLITDHRHRTFSSTRSAAAWTASAEMVVRHRKSPGAQTRWSHGRQGNAPASTDTVGIVAGRHGADRSGSVGPYSPTTGTSDVDAMCSGPLSPPMYNAARSTRAR